MDTLNPAQRSRNMAAIKGKDTKPEWIVRRLLHGMGYRYRLQGRDLPGRPDIVFPARHCAIEIRGCYWHRHAGCRFTTTPTTRADFWRTKFAATVARDARNLALMEAAGWRVLVIWECELAGPALADRVRAFLGPTRKPVPEAV